MSNSFEAPDPEDMFSDTRMSFGDHIEDLRSHLIRALKGFVIGMILGIWPLGHYVFEIIVEPVQTQLYEFAKRKYDREWEKAEARREIEGKKPENLELKISFHKQQLAKAVGIKPNPDDADGLVVMDVQIEDPRQLFNKVHQDHLDVIRPTMVTMHITESFLTYFWIAILTGLVISSPWVFYHLWMFIAAGLYPHEKKLVNVYLPFSLILFLGGVCVCQFLVMPRAISAMLWFNEWLGLGADLRLNEWLNFALMMPIIFGVCFQTPLVMMFLHRVGIVPLQSYREYRRAAWFVMAVLAAVFLPTPDAYSLIFLWLPMVGLYEFGILLCVWQGERPLLFDVGEEEKSDEMVEV
jgi:sec-independent protein translocase protein TatC